VHEFSRVRMILRERIGPSGPAPGAVLRVRFNEEVVFHEAYGYRQILPQELPTTEETLFDLASLTKSVGTSLAVMQLWSQKKIDLDARIGLYHHDIEGTGKEWITIRHLLSHTSGLPAWRPYFREVATDARPVSPLEMYRRILGEPVEAPLGTKEIYSDLGFMLLGWILECLTGEPLDRLFSRLIFSPLGLSQTGFRRISCQGTPEGIESKDHSAVASTEWCPWRGRMLTGEVHDENCYAMGMVAGHAGLFSTAEELDRIMFEVMKGYQGVSRVFGKEGVRTFLNRQEVATQGSWALGWDTPSPQDSSSGIYFSKNSFGHNGFTGTSIWMDVDRGVSVILLTNRVHPRRERQGIKQLRQDIHNAVMISVGLAQD